MALTQERIQTLIDKGYITKVVDVAELAKLTEAQLIDKGYITEVGIFDGSDDSIEEVPSEVEPVMVIDDDAPVVDDGDEPVVDPAEE